MISEVSYVFVTLHDGSSVDVNKAHPGMRSVFNEVERGEASYDYIRRRQVELAAGLDRQVLVYVYNGFRWSWEYNGRTLPNGDHYDWLDKGPWVVAADGKSYVRKEEGGEQ